MKQAHLKAFIRLLEYLDFHKDGNTYAKIINGTKLAVNVAKEEILYPKDKEMIINERQTCNFSFLENFVVFECVHRLLEKGYKPEHLELEPRWRVGRGASGGRADILVKNHENEPLLLIECKTAGKEFDREWKKTRKNGGQLFSYVHQIPTTQYLCLYASNFVNGEIVRDNKIISHIDNKKFLKQNSNLRSFSGEIKNAADRFSIWRDTYRLAYAEVGIFEESVQAYQIGKSKYTLKEDTKPIDARDKKGKYHQFRTILRKHNIARRETAFEVLVNLFLCKIVDEEGNPEDLKFYWKGAAYDNHFDFVDRLQDLYHRGMGRFLNEKISYISNEQIDNAFWMVKGGRNATKEQIQKYFRELKFFTNSAFSFLDTHNEALFYKNTEVLLEVVQMWQNLRLRSGGQNQFLSDMFEFFLDNGIKQSNGQFFTPLPICKFIVSALPLKAKIAALEEPPRVIDYACGAGHFLNEYAHQILPLVEKGEKPASEYYKNIIGVEKEYRLAKVAKVAAYMYGQGEIRILDVDALGEHDDIHLGNYDVLVANPPFAVEGFLQTLGDEDKERYKLTKVTGEDSDTNAIQCFFLERVCHLMAPAGVVGVIVPSSILSNGDAVHIRTRELLLQFFDFVAIAELGGGTFGKTGTKTVVLFLRRKTQKPECFQQYKNRAEDFFEGDIKHKEYQDEKLIKAYCRHIDIPYEEYAKLLVAESGGEFKDLFQFEMFKEYQSDWEKNAEIKKLKETPNFQAKNKHEQQAELDKRLLGFLQEQEKDKLLYFILAYKQANEVLIVNAPSGNKQQKDFLGYEWGTRKGSEGIKYKGGDTVNDIVTPMFDPKNLDNPDKINAAIKRNFTSKLSEPLPKHCRLANLVDMLDFGRVGFDKAISTNPQKNITIETKWELAKLGDALYTIESGNRPKGGVGNISSGAWSLGGEHIHPNNGKVYLEPPKYVPVDFYKKSQKGVLKENDILLCKDGALTGKIALLEKELNNKMAMVNEHVFILRGRSLIEQKYIFNFLFSIDGQALLKQNITGSAQGGLNATNLKQIKIPLPDKITQKKIVSECEAVDKEMEKARKIITVNKQKIEEKMQAVVNANYEMKSLENIAKKIFAGGDVPKNDFSKVKTNKQQIPIYANGIENKGLYGYTSITKVNEASITISARGTLGYTEVRTEIFYPIVRLIVLIPDSSNNIYYLKYAIQRLSFINVGSVIPQLTVPKIKNYKIPVPPLKIQQKLVAELEKLEAKITEAQTTLDTAPARKNTILKKYL